MATQRSSISRNSAASDDDFPRRQRPKIKRVRTGCFTCRQRRKKCDEARPACKACVKQNVVCDGYTPTTIWKNRTVGRRADGRRTQKSKSSPMENEEAPDCSGERPAWKNAGSWNGTVLHVCDEDFLSNNGELPQIPSDSASLIQLPSNYFDSGNLSIEGEVADESLLTFSQFSPAIPFAQPLGASMQNMAMFSSQQASAKIFGSNGVLPFTTSSYITRRSTMPPELPFLIAGIESHLHRRLFYHFTHVMSKVLTTSGDDSNPMNTVLVPLAMGDKTLLRAILSISSSHLLKLMQNGIDPELSAERNRLHEDVLNTQKQRIQALKDPAATFAWRGASENKEAVFATSLLLCLYEICEGTGDDNWRIHLDSCRDLLSCPSVSATMNPFLLEFFLYHDSLAMVTVPSTNSRVQYASNLSDSDQNPSLVGVQDGLIEYVTRISSLRSEASPIASPPTYEILDKALAIWEDLFHWKPKATFCKTRTLIAEFYQWALFIWLYSIVYPDGKSDTAVQSNVQRMIMGMSDIKYGDGVMACLLFPLFVVGSAAIRLEDRTAVEGHFKRVRAWSSLGNVDLTFKVVEKMWQEHDEGMPRSWDWVMQLERHGLSLLVT